MNTIDDDTAGKIWFTVDGTTRMVVDSTEYAHALAEALNQLGHRASHVPSACTIHFKRDTEEKARATLLLEEVVHAKGGLSIVDLRSENLFTQVHR